jgi:hypothetical protein
MDGYRLHFIFNIIIQMAQVIDTLSLTFKNLNYILHSHLPCFGIPRNNSTNRFVFIRLKIAYLICGPYLITILQHSLQFLHHVTEHVYWILTGKHNV